MVTLVIYRNGAEGNCLRGEYITRNQIMQIQRGKIIISFRACKIIIIAIQVLNFFMLPAPREIIFSSVLVLYRRYKS